MHNIIGRTSVLANNSSKMKYQYRLKLTFSADYEQLICLHLLHRLTVLPLTDCFTLSVPVFPPQAPLHSAACQTHCFFPL